MTYIHSILMILCTIVLASTCQQPSSKTQATGQGQGIKGNVKWLEGNLMPSPGIERPKGKPIEREILVYELTHMDQGERSNGLYQSLETEMVGSTKSDENGAFSIALPPGNYSVLVKEEDGLFANRFNGKGHINAVEVKEGQFSEIEITVDYKAAY